MLRRWIEVSGFLVVAAVLACSIALAQPRPRTSRVSGTVTDPTRVAVSGVEVLLESSDSRRIVATLPTGLYQFDDLPPGNYSLSLVVPGFKRVQQDFALNPGQSRRQNIRLELAVLRDELTVQERDDSVSAEINANRNAISVERGLLDDIPVSDLDYIAALSRFLDSSGVGGGDSLIVDGVEMRSAGVSPSAIQEIRINENPYTAEYPRWSRRRIEVITKSATDKYHGTVNYLFRDARLNARPAFAGVRPPERRNIFEGSLFGPIGSRGKSAFLLSGMRENDDLYSVVYAQTPTGLRTGTVPTPDRNTMLSLRISHMINDNHDVFWQINYQDQHQNNLGVGGIVLPEAGSRYRFREDELIFNHRGVLSPTLLTQFRILVGRYWAPLSSNTQAQRLTVTDAFVGGGAQADNLRTEGHTAIAWILTQSYRNHTLKYGVNIPDWSRRAYADYAYRQGAFSFASLDDYYANRPFLATVQQGDPKAVFIEKNVGIFLQDEWRVRDNLSISAGLRYDWQGVFGDRNNFAPRLAFAYAPGQNRKLVLRGGAGYFYDRSGPYPVWDLLRYDGNRLLRYVINSPSYPDQFVGPALVGQPVARVVRDPAAGLPLMMQFSAGIERQLARQTTLAVTYVGLRGVQQFRSLDLNAPTPDTGWGMRPDERFNIVRNIESSGRIESNALEVTLRGTIAPKVTGIAQYTFGKTMADFDGYAGYRGTFARESQYGFGQTLANAGAAVWFPADSYEPRGEWGRTDLDRRHQFNLLATGKFHPWLNLGVTASILSGVPFNVTTGNDDNRDGLPFDRPDGVSRNTGLGPGLLGIDLRWFREFRFASREGTMLVVSADAFNVLNRVNFQNYVGAQSSPFYGQPVGSLPPRRLQLGLRFQF
ncbi:MAG: TonB-dependent receptor [Bryobacterales bacterium]|nr:TonB-dependent receptor [Bryobacterales bacterium]